VGKSEDDNRRTQIGSYLKLVKNIIETYITVV
jgi:hypothetical protein